MMRMLERADDKDVRGRAATFKSLLIVPTPNSQSPNNPTPNSQSPNKSIISISKYARPVHKSVQVGFVPNSEPTRSVRVSHFWICYWQVKGVCSGGRTFLDTSRFSVEVAIFETMSDFAEIHQIWLRLGQICRDLAGSRRDLGGSQRDLTGSQWDLDEFQRDQVESWRDLDEILPDLNKISVDLKEIRPNLD